MLCNNITETNKYNLKAFLNNLKPVKDTFEEVECINRIAIYIVLTFRNNIDLEGAKILHFVNKDLTLNLVKSLHINKVLH